MIKNVFINSLLKAEKSNYLTTCVHTEITIRIRQQENTGNISK